MTPASLRLHFDFAGALTSQAGAAGVGHAAAATRRAWDVFVNGFGRFGSGSHFFSLDRLSFLGCLRGPDVRIHLVYVLEHPLGNFSMQQEVKFHIVAIENAPFPLAGLKLDVALMKAIGVRRTSGKIQSESGNVIHYRGNKVACLDGSGVAQDGPACC